MGRNALLGLVAVVVGLSLLHAQPTQDSSSAKLLLAFSSKRDSKVRGVGDAKIYFYEHDSVGHGTMSGFVKTEGRRHRALHPTLSQDGRFCAFSIDIHSNDGPGGARIEIYDRTEKKLLDLPELRERNKVHDSNPCLSGNGKQVVFTAWAWPATPRKSLIVELPQTPVVAWL